MAEITTLGLIPFPAPIKVTVGSNLYALRGRTEVPSSNSQWGQAEEGRGFVNTPWAANGDSAALASQFTEYAFLANPAYWNGTPPSGATYVLVTPEPTTTQGLLYYQGDGQLHYTRGTSNVDQKVVFYIGENVDYYVSHDEDNNVSDPQPGFTTAISPLEGSGWTAIEYRNYNADYVRHDENNQVGVVSSFVRHGVDGQLVPTARYVRMDENNNPVDSQPEITQLTQGTIYAPDGLVEGRDIFASAAVFSGGTPPFTYEGQFQRNDGSGWVGFSGWEQVTSATRTLTSSEVGMNIRVNTRVSDRNTPEGQYEIAPGISTGPVVQQMAINVRGDLTGTGTVGSTLTQTESTIVGGIGPFTKAYEWIRRPIGGTDFKRFGAPNGLTYTVQADDVGYEIRGRTRWVDAYGFSKSIACNPSQIAIT